MSEVPPMTFWDHLDELRSVLIRILVVTVLIAAFAFCLKDELFAVVLAPRTSDFITYRLMGVEPFSIHLMNTGLTEQFMIHMKTAFYAGVLVASPYILYVACGHWLCDVHVGNGSQLPAHFPFDGEVSWNLSGESRRCEYADIAVVYRYAVDDVSYDGYHL